jgi:hypothetical protein
LLLGRLRFGGSQFETSPGKKFSRIPLSEKKMGAEVCACLPSYDRKCKIGRSQSKLPRQKGRLYFQNNQNKKD